MPKPTIEFTPTSSFELVVPAGPLARTEASYRVLAEDLSTGDKTVILIHPPSQEWGGDAGKDSQAVHVYWEVSTCAVVGRGATLTSGSPVMQEVLILRGRIFDKGLQQWFSGGYSFLPVKFPSIKCLISTVEF